MDAGISPEANRVPVVDIKYDRMESKDSLFRVDGVALGQAMVGLGYPSGVVKPLIIDDLEHPYEIAQYDYTRRSIVIHQKPLIESVKNVYRNVLEQMGEIPPKTVQEENDLLHRFLRSKFFQTVFPAYWPYKGIKNEYNSLFAGNAKRRNQYLKAAREGTLEPDKPLEEQRERAKKHMERLVEMGMKRYSGWVMAHEYEHIHHVGKKAAIKIGLGLAPMVAGYALLDVITKQMQQAGATPTNITDALILGILGAGGAGIYGLAQGRKMEEQASYDAGYKNMAKFMECFTINQDVFAKEVLGKEAPPPLVSPSTH